MFLGGGFFFKGVRTVISGSVQSSVDRDLKYNFPIVTIEGGIWSEVVGVYLEIESISGARAKYRSVTPTLYLVAFVVFCDAFARELLNKILTIIRV